MTYVCFKSTESIQRFPEYEVGVVLLIAYFSFAMAELFEGSGIVSLFITSILLGHYNVRNLSITSQRTAGLLFKVLSVFSESFIYLLFGLVITKAIVFSWEGRHAGAIRTFDWPMFGITMCLLIVSRAMVIFPSANLINFIEDRYKYNMEEVEEGQVIARACMHAAFEKSITSRYTPMAKSLLGSHDGTPTDLVATQCGMTRTTYRQDNSDLSSESRSPPDLSTPLLAVERTITESPKASLQSSFGYQLSQVDANTCCLYPSFGQRQCQSPKSPYAELPSFVSRISASEFLDLNSPSIHIQPLESVGSTPQPLEFPTGGPNASRKVNFAAGAVSPVFEDAHSVAGLPRFGFLPDGTAEVLARLPGQKIHEYVEELREYRKKLKSENRLYTKVLDLPCQILLWMSGLRGAIAFVLALSVPAMPTSSGKHNANLLVTTTLSVIVISTVAFGSFIELYALKYHIIRRVPEDADEVGSSDSPLRWRRNIAKECEHLWQAFKSTPGATRARVVGEMQHS